MPSQPIISIYETPFGELHILETSFTAKINFPKEWKKRTRPELTPEELDEVIEQTEAILSEWRGERKCLINP